jgi:hypothetical protein
VSANGALNALWLGGQLQTNSQNLVNGDYGSQLSGGSTITVQVIVL